MSDLEVTAPETVAVLEDEVAADELAVLDDERLTLAGLFSESWSGVHRYVEHRLKAETGLPLQWFILMLRISRSPRGRLRLSDLASQTGMSPSGLTRALDRLEEAGLAERTACDDDRRGAFATITAQGLEVLIPAVHAHLGHLDAALLQTLTSAEQAELSRLLRKIRDHVNPEASRPPEPIDA